jgi:hypothetical protein
MLDLFFRVMSCVNDCGLDLVLLTFGVLNVVPKSAGEAHVLSCFGKLRQRKLLLGLKRRVKWARVGLQVDLWPFDRPHPADTWLSILDFVVNTSHVRHGHKREAVMQIKQAMLDDSGLCPVSCEIVELYFGKIDQCLMSGRYTQRRDELDLYVRLLKMYLMESMTGAALYYAPRNNM